MRIVRVQRGSRRPRLGVVLFVIPNQQRFRRKHSGRSFAQTRVPAKPVLLCWVEEHGPR